MEAIEIVRRVMQDQGKTAGIAREEMKQLADLHRDHPRTLQKARQGSRFLSRWACYEIEGKLGEEDFLLTLRDTVRTAPYGLPGSKELAENCTETLGETAKAVLLANHGAVCLGRDLEDAFKTARVLELTAELCVKIRAAGGQPEALPESVKKALLNM